MVGSSSYALFKTIVSDNVRDQVKHKQSTGSDAPTFDTVRGLPLAKKGLAGFSPSGINVYSASGVSFIVKEVAQEVQLGRTPDTTSMLTGILSGPVISMFGTLNTSLTFMCQ